jgi:hypothetical protein
MAGASNVDSITIYQSIRETISGFDSILVTLLTQGNTFVIGVLSVPIVANLRGVHAGVICFCALVLSIFFLLANLLYRNLLQRSVEIAGQLEKNNLKSMGDNFHITEQLNKLPLSAERGSFFLYCVLPSILVLVSIIQGAIYFLQESSILFGGFILIALLVVVGSIAIYGVCLRRVA